MKSNRIFRYLMRMSSRVLTVSGLLFVFLSFTEVNAQDTVKTVAPVAHPTDTMWMVFSSLLVIMMSLPGLALFYGGMVRSKNMISVLMQVFSLFCLITVLWVIYGYSFAFTGGSAFIGSWDKLFLSGVTPASMAATFTKGAVIPEILFIIFQCAFAAITVGLIVGAFAERAKFSAVILFSVLWFTVSYLPVAHMVWYWDGPDAITDAASAAAVSENAGFLWRMGALDFAGGTVIHINAAIAGLVGAYMIGKRVGYGVDQMAPHSLPLNMIGAALLWVGWFGFNAGSALALDSVALQAILNTLIAAATAGIAWMSAEMIKRKKTSLLGLISGVIGGLVTVTPGAGFVGVPGAIIMGLIGGVACWWGVTYLKRMISLDDSLDVFGIHGVGGIVGALLTGVFTDPALGGSGIYDYVTNSVAADYSIITQVWVQLKAVLVTIVWSGVASAVIFKLVDITIGLRVSEDDERVGLDITQHGEKAYHS